MSKNDPNNIKAYHNKGQSDKAEKKGYNTPNNAVGGALNLKHETAQNVAYNKGFKNATKSK